MFIDTLSALEWDIEVHMDYVDHEDYNSYMQEERKAAQKLLGV